MGRWPDLPCNPMEPSCGSRCEMTCNRERRASAPRRRPRARSCWAGRCISGRSCESKGIEPTNNDAERALRPAVIYLKTSGGTDSKSGSRFMERILSVVATCHQQEINVLEYLTRCNQAHLDGQPVPLLLPTSSTAQAV
jgi:hypothetical protein